jgi:glycosyltransferase involved in cell wall biosynthesis
MKVLFIAPTGNSNVVDAGYTNASLGIFKVLTQMKEDEKFNYITKLDHINTSLPIESQKIDYEYDIAILVIHPSSFENTSVAKVLQATLDKAQRRYLSIVWEADPLPIAWKWLWNSDLFDGFLAPSKFVGKLLAKETKKPVFYYPHYINIKQFKPISIEEKLIEDKFMVLFVGQYTKRKGLEDSIISFARSLGFYKDARLVLKYFYMSKNEVPIEMLVRNIVQANCTNWAASVFILDEQLSNRGMSDLYRNSSLFLSLARGEGFGLGNIEAMSVNIPVIYTNWSAMVETSNAPGNIAIDYYLDETIGMTQFGSDIGSQYAIPSIGKTMEALKLKYNLWKTDRRKYYEEVSGNRDIVDQKFGYEAISGWLDIILNNKIEDSLNYEHRNR